MDLIETRRILEDSQSLYLWLKKIDQQPEIARFLFATGYEEKKELVELYLNAAINIAGECPWPLKFERYSIRTLNWKSANNTSHVYGENELLAVPKTSSWGVAYRSVRRQIYHQYVKPHKACWNRLNHYDPIEMHYLDSDSICYMSVAFAIWCLVNERQFTLQQLSSPEVEHNKIFIFMVDHNDFELTLTSYVNILYAQFFLIWHYLLNEPKAVIQLAPDRYKRNYFAINNFGSNWNLIIPSPEYLIKKSTVDCLSSLNIYGFMLLPRMAVEWFDDMRLRKSMADRVLFRLNTYQGRGGFRYFNF